MPERFEDARGVIQDLLGPIDAVTEITTKAGCVRGNHIHHRTTQWVYVVSGALLVTDGGRVATYTRGCFFEEPPGVPHAWRAEQDTRVLVFTKGPRSGEAFESDTERLAVPLIEPSA
jgi:quercetin dioxygenase-like cupin family protein